MNKTVLKASLGLALFSTMLVANTQMVQATETTNISQSYADNSLDVTQGWKVNFSTNLANVHEEDIFKQNMKSPTSTQKMVLNNFGNIGNAELTAKKTITMKKGHTYNLDLIYAMQFSNGSGYIDFNGEKIDSASINNDAKDHAYKKVVKADADMDYVITIYYKVPMRATGYLKLAYDTSLGNGIEEQSNIASPELIAPTEGQTKITGTGISGNTINIYDAAGKLLGSGTVNSQNNFEITVNRPFIKGEEITGYQVDKNGVISEKGTAIVKEALNPSKPELDNPITEDTTTITGKADPGATVDVNIGDEHYETVADDDGNFSVELDHTFPYGTEVHTTAKDKEGNASEPLDTIVEYADTAKIDFDYTLSSIDQYISGTSSRPNTKVEIKVGARIFSTTTDDQGNYVLELPTTYKPGTPVKATITDKAGTTAVANQIILPRMPTLPSLSSGIKEIFGVVDPNAVVKLVVTQGENSYNLQTTADASGDYTISLKDPDTGADIVLGVGDKVEAQATLESLGLSSEVLTTTIWTRALN
ncbi:hypothetical protein A5821_002070 [Enterococcus sp. 7F3_DIV0205]|uniref:Bacterial Ig domain-containing protein n=1 Tax=Candidatus Enterococcus palustris TaxID=1834189 RepID=A0AAQ3W948_9ENTE|nr:Ig-like domain-containing protein [Enterococcus sp. 7F3_DIV0205]OTN82509.1 hypothetical protein A5821_002420 [Enterococcus sp. 7F3_DIV0205]